jgi:hypothetical protein
MNTFLIHKTHQEHDPQTISMDIDSTSAFADGLHTGELEAIIKNVPLKYIPRIARRPLLPTEFLAARAEGMLETYQKLMQNAHSIIAEGFSTRVITPGVTTTADVQWFFRDKIQASNFTTWFHPSVDLTRNTPNGVIQISGPDAIIEKGDLLW